MVVALILTAVSPGAVAREFRTADAQDDPPVQARNYYMAPLVTEQTGGRPSIRNFHSRELGEESDTITQTPATAIDLDRTNVALMGDVVSTTSVPAMQFLFRSAEHLQRVPGGPISDEIPESFEPCGFVGTFYVSGARSIYMRDPATAEPIKRVGQTE